MLKLRDLAVLGSFILLLSACGLVFGHSAARADCKVQRQTLLDVYNLVEFDDQGDSPGPSVTWWGPERTGRTGTYEEACEVLQLEFSSAPANNYPVILGIGRVMTAESAREVFVEPPDTHHEYVFRSDSRYMDAVDTPIGMDWISHHLAECIVVYARWPPSLPLAHDAEHRDGVIREILAKFPPLCS